MKLQHTGFIRPVQPLHHGLVWVCGITNKLAMGIPQSCTRHVEAHDVNSSIPGLSWLGAWLWCLYCITNGDITVLHLSIGTETDFDNNWVDMNQHRSAWWLQIHWCKPSTTISLTSTHGTMLHSIYMWYNQLTHPGPVFCLLLRVSSDCAWQTTGQVTVIGWA